MLLLKIFIKKGTTNHILINPIMDYDLNHFRLYCNLVIKEMEKRGYNVSDKTKAKLNQYLHDRISVSNTFGEQLSVLINNEYEPLFDNWHTDR